ncbi:olfactory receptor 10S1-like [Sardina pilchardus]|uniref:olfactory receptor 10S1-like n=1 Tax=Sardina pilchardus TaxID=27697 RepID=UPI002E0F7219
MTKLSTQSHTISLVNCLLQIYCLHTFGIVELMILAIMGYDRYAAICTPLHYHAKMCPRKVKILIAILRICLHASKECQKKALQTCLPHLLIVINYFFGACFELIQIYCLHTWGTIELMILATMGYDRYIAICTPLHYHENMSPRKILRVCMHASTECRKKAIQTCAPHLFTFINYFFGAFFEFIYTRFRNTQQDLRNRVVGHKILSEKLQLYSVIRS